MNKIYSKIVCTSALILFSSLSSAMLIQLEFAGSTTYIGSSLTGDVVSVGDAVVGSVIFDTELLENNSISYVGISIGNEFKAASTAGLMEVKDDFQRNTSSNPYDLLRLSSFLTTSELNGHQGADYQFSLLRLNSDGQLWSNSDIPDISDLQNITLSDLNSADWHGIDFGLPLAHFTGDQVRWEINEFSIGALYTVDEPSSLALLLIFLMSFMFLRQYPKLKTYYRL